MLGTFPEVLGWGQDRQESEGEIGPLLSDHCCTSLMRLEGVSDPESWGASNFTLHLPASWKRLEKAAWAGTGVLVGLTTKGGYHLGCKFVLLLCPGPAEVTRVWHAQVMHCSFQVCNMNVMGKVLPTTFELSNNCARKTNQQNWTNAYTRKMAVMGWGRKNTESTQPGQHEGGHRWGQEWQQKMRNKKVLLQEPASHGICDRGWG